MHVLVERIGRAQQRSGPLRVHTRVERIERRAQQRSGPLYVHACVVPGDEPFGAEAAGEVEHRVEAHVAVAADAGVGGVPAGVALEPAVDDAGAELLAQVDREVGQPEAVCERASAADGLRGAAAALAVVLGVGPQLQGDRDDLLAGARGEQRGDGGVDPAAHRDEGALRARARARRARGRAAPSARCSASAASSAAWRLAGLQAAELVRRSHRRRRARRSSRGAPRTSATAALPAAIAAPQPEASKPASRDHALGAAGLKRQREAHEIAAGGPTGGAGEGVRGGVSAPGRAIQVSGEAPRRSSRRVYGPPRRIRPPGSTPAWRSGLPVRFGDGLLDRESVGVAGQRRDLSAWG